MKPIITTDQQVRQFTPNVFATVEGEVSLFDKLKPFLDDAQLWLESIVPVLTPINHEQSVLPSEEESSEEHQPGGEVPGVDGDESISPQEAAEVPAEEVDESTDPRLVHTQRILVTEAFRRAIPSLDLVLTPNGFGIVSNDNMAPASSDRVNRLIDQLEAERDSSIKQLVELQMSMDASVFTTYPQYRHWVDTIFRPFELQRINGSRHLLADWLTDRYKINHIEVDLAEKYLSMPILAKLRLASTGQMSKDYLYLSTQFAFAVTEVAAGRECPVHFLRSLADYCRKTWPEEWEASSTAVRFEDHSFPNHKNSKGFWM